MDNKYGLNDTITVDEYEDVLVSELLEEKGLIFSLIKEHHINFDDEVLEKARIKKYIRNEYYYIS